MAYDEALADDVRVLLAARSQVTEKKMFGGLAWMLNGNMAVAALGGSGLMVRVGPDSYEKLLEEPGAEETIMKGRPFRGWITVAPATYADFPALEAWVRRGIDFASTLQPK